MMNTRPPTATVNTPLPSPRGIAGFRTALLRLPILQIAVLTVLAAWLVATVPSILNPVSIVSILMLVSLLALAAMGQTLVVILGGLDLAIPGYIIVGSFVASNLATGAGWPLPLALLTTVAVCGGVGAFVGFVSHRYEVQPLVLTLGVSAALTGGTLFIANADYSSAPPDALRSLTGITSTTFGLPVPPLILIVVVAAVLVWLFLARTVNGRRLYATGANRRAAGLARISTGTVWTGVFAMSGVTAGIAGMLLASFSSGWNATSGDPYLFTGLAAVLLGGTTFGSIRGSYTRTVLGATILTLLSTIVVSNGMSDGQSRIIYGLVIIGVVALYGRDRHVRDRF